MWRFPTSIYDRGFNNHSVEIPPLLIEKAMFGHSQHGVLRQSDCYANFADQQYQHSFTQWSNVSVRLLSNETFAK